MMYPYAITTRRPSPRRRGGFTLIELLVVIAIIALLVSILLPSLTKAKQLAQRVVCSSNHKNLAMGHLYYTEENDGWFSPTDTHIDPYTFNGITRDAYLPWFSVELVGPYIGNEHPCATAFPSKLQASSTDMVYCPLRLAEGASHPLKTGIGYNRSRQNFFNRYDMGWPDWKGRTLVRADNFEHATLTFILMDVAGAGNQFTWDRYYDGDSHGWTATNDGPSSTHTGYTTYRHLNSTPVAFADGHVEIIGTQDPSDPLDGADKARADGILTHKAAY